MINMTPEEEAALIALVKSLQEKVAAMEGEKTATETEEVDSLKSEMVELTGEKLDSFQSWDKDSLKKSVGVLKKNKKIVPAGNEVPDQDTLVPKLDSNKKEIPYAMRIDWSKASYPEWK